jgi:hypothetical protein
LSLARSLTHKTKNRDNLPVSSRLEKYSFHVQFQIQIIGKVFGRLYGKDYDSGMHFSSLIGSIKIDFATFLEFHEKYKLRKLLEKLEAEEPDEETKLKIYKAMDIDGDGLISEFEFKQWAKKTLQVKFSFSEKATKI